MHYSKLHNHAAGCGSSAFAGGKNNIILSQIITHQELQAGLLKARIIIQIVTNKTVKTHEYYKIDSYKTYFHSIFFSGEPIENTT